MIISVEVVVWCTVLSVLAVLVSSITAIFSIMAYSRVVGLEKSTHQIQYVPLDQPKTGEDLDKSMYDAFGYKEEQEDYIG
jgi:hypothetical protein